MSKTRSGPLGLLYLALLFTPVLGETDVQSDWSGGGDAAGRTVTSAPVTITVPVESSEGLSLSAPYPNPARDCVEVEAVLTAESGPAELAVYDLGGRLIESRGLSGTAGRQRIVLATDGYAAGVYLAQLEGAEASARRRFVITR